MEEWCKQLWTAEGPLKAKVTLWLTLNNKILTWDNLQKRGWNGPNWCALYNSNEENFSHLSNICSYADTVWKTTCRELKFQGTLGTTLEYKAKAWWTDKSVCLHSAFPSLFTYGIWWARNTATFNNKMIPFEVTAALVIQWTREHRSQVKEEKFRVLVPPEINKEIPWAFFDRASQGDPPLGGVGAVIFFFATKKTKIKYAMGHASNNKE